MSEYARLRCLIEGRFGNIFRFSSAIAVIEVIDGSSLNDLR